MYYYLKFQGFPEEIRVNYDRGKKTKRLAVSIVLRLSDYTSLFADSFSHPITNASEPKAVNRDSGKDLAELFVMS